MILANVLQLSAMNTNRSRSQAFHENDSSSSNKNLLSALNPNKNQKNYMRIACQSVIKSPLINQKQSAGSSVSSSVGKKKSDTPVDHNSINLSL